MTVPVVAVALVALSAALAQQQPEITRVRLARDTTISGVRCAPTGRASAELFRDGRLASCPLANDTTISGHRLVAGTWIDLWQEGTLKAGWLVHDTQLGGLVCKGTGYKGWRVEFHPGGPLKLCFLVHEETISGVPCRAGTFLAELRGTTQVHFHENGALKSCSVAEAVDRDGIHFRPRQRIQLDTAGRVTRAAP